MACAMYGLALNSCGVCTLQLASACMLHNISVVVVQIIKLFAPKTPLSHGTWNLHLLTEAVA